MGDSGEGLVDNESRIQERIEELQRSRAQGNKKPVRNVELIRKIESLQLARKETLRSLETSSHEARKKQLEIALADIDRRIAGLQTSPNE